MPALPRRALRRARFRTALLIVLLGLGVLIPPTASAAPLPAVAPAPTALTAQVGSFSFALGPNQLRRLPIEMLPYYANSLVSSCGLTDPTGVAMYRAPDGMIYDHPVAQTRCALNMLRNYRISAEDQYLDQAIANAQRLLDRADTFQGASFFPYPFPYTNPGRGQMTPPWYSAMAQGQALSVFIRLLEWTGDARWRTAADQTFASFKIPRSAGGPWVVGVEGGRLWLDEYPTTPLDRVFNGHNFSAYGLYDYWRVTDSSEARLMLLGALNSTAFVGASRVRVPGGISQYCASDACLAHRVRHPSYHITHFGQLTVLFHITGHWSFASLAEALQADSPRTSGGVARLAAGTQDGYTFDSAGVGTLVTRVSLAAPATVAFTRRDVPGGRYHPGNGIWLRITEEPLAGL